MSSIAVVFPGQGSQVLGMGQEFCQQSETARGIFALAEAQSGLPLKDLCFQGPMDELTRTVNLQPAMAAVDLCCWEALLAKGVTPAYVAGHSLGEYPALCAAGVFTQADCLRLVTLRAQLMDRDAAAHPGAMSALVGPSPAEVEELCAGIAGVIQPANFNAPTQTVITGGVDEVAQAGKLAKEKGWKAIPLKVSGAWHSPFMAEAGQEMALALTGTEMTPPKLVHVPNTTGRPTKDLDEIKLEIGRQLTSPVRWVQTVEALLAAGVDTFIECGPKNVLAGLVKKTAPESVKVLNFATPAELDAVLAQL